MLKRILARQCVHWSKKRLLCAIPLQQEPEFQTMGTEKQYPDHIVTIVNQISQLTLVETAELNELLKVCIRK